MQLKKRLRWSQIASLLCRSFYGKAYANGSAVITGPFNAINLDITATTVDNGEFHLPLGGKGSAKISDLLIFKQEEIPVQPNDAKFFVFSDKEITGQAGHDNPRHSRLSSRYSRLDRESPLEGPWHIRFQSDRGAPSEAVFDTLYSFTESEDPGIRYFSGTATYTKDFTLDNPAQRTLLSLGDVKNIAEVIVNGKSVRTLWKEPYEVEITDYLKEGANTLEIRVTNLWPNRLIGDAALPESERITYTGFSFYSADDPLLPSGLIGPIRLFQQ